MPFSFQLCLEDQHKLGGNVILSKTRKLLSDSKFLNGSIGAWV